VLLHRTTRVVRLTDAGAHFLADCKRLLGELEEAESRAAGLHAEPKGRLAITAPVMFGRLFVAPLILDFLDRFPGVEVCAQMADRVVDLIDEGFDVAVRIAHLPDSSLVAARVGSVRQVVCAAPAYLAAHGTPQRLADLAHFEAIAFGTVSARAPWSFGGERAEPPTRLIVNAPDVALAAAIAGRGLLRTLSYQVAAELRAGRLVRVLADFEPPPIPIQVVYQEGRRASARVRAFVDFAVERLRADESLH